MKQAEYKNIYKIFAYIGDLKKSSHKLRIANSIKL